VRQCEHHINPVSRALMKSLIINDGTWRAMRVSVSTMGSRDGTYVLLRAPPEEAYTCWGTWCHQLWRQDCDSEKRKSRIGLSLPIAGDSRRLIDHEYANTMHVESNPTQSIIRTYELPKPMSKQHSTQSSLLTDLVHLLENVQDGTSTPSLSPARVITE